ncbi:Ano10 [Symbiodinium pilosum]|uniref:Ano10 protein n=1 Tax=Symbiodinium pilosum TaxID=2952 RepID=A0A812MA28_SYMPI|nr:Ano10 [Symbiodinium pilosum]
MSQFSNEKRHSPPTSTCQCRPWRGSDATKEDEVETVWRPIFEGINLLAVLTNVGLAALFFYPERLFSAGDQLTTFLVAEHSILLLQAAVRLLIPSIPADVARIDLYNRHVLHVLHSTQLGLTMRKAPVGPHQLGP